MFGGHSKICFILNYLFCWEQIAAIKVINTFGNGEESFGDSRDRDFATVFADLVSNLPWKITICASLKTNDGPNVLSFYQLLNDKGLSVLSTQLLNFNREDNQRIKLVGAVDDKIYFAEIPITPMQRYFFGSTQFYYLLGMLNRL